MAREPSIPVIAMLLLLRSHGYGLRPALSGADAATLAVIEISLEVALLVMMDTSLGAEEGADAALDASILVPGGLVRSPVTGLVLSGVARRADDGADINVAPGEFGVLLLCAHVLLS